MLFPFFIFGCDSNIKRPSQKVNDVSQDTLLPTTDMNITVSAAKIGVNKLERFGQYLTDKEGRALYMFKGDQRSKSSACYGNCSEIWPPLLTTGKVTAIASSVDKEMLGTIMRRDSSLQVTYNGWPLYYYKKDADTGSVKGQNVNSFGGDWYLMAPDGHYIDHSNDKNPQTQQEENNTEQM